MRQEIYAAFFIDFCKIFLDISWLFPVTLHDILAVLFTMLYPWKSIKLQLTLINISFSPTYLTSHALVTRYLNKMKKLITSFQLKSCPGFVAERIMRQTSHCKVCSSSPSRGDCFYNSDEKFYYLNV